MLNSLYTFLTDKPIPFHIFHHSSLPQHINLNYKLIHSLLWINGPNKSPNFETFVCFGESLPNSSCYFPNYKLVFFSNFTSLSSVMKGNSSLFFLAQTLYTLVKSSPLKCKILRLLSAWFKISQIPYVNFETKSAFLYQIFHHSSVPLQLLCKFLAHTFSWKKDYMKKKTFFTISNAVMKICQIPHFIFQIII